MTTIGWLQIILYCAIIVALTPVLGAYMTRVFNGERTFLTPVLRPVEALLYRAGGNLVYRNDLKSACPGLARDSDIMVVEQFGSSTCSGDFFHLVDRSSGIRGPTCVFGDFVPYRKPAGDGG